ncbi:MAG TPA: ATP-binding cassette domain-containing protein [Solirubrobacteraceae bacterium]|jgi:ABC-type lipoprotein export system ATPase subunit|nr:ATP-binding cassette domain-containing protein [Solirubrobacteraceae bacterium]
MTLLALEEVSRRRRHGGRELPVLRDVSLRVDAGELVAIWGVRRSGRSTLLRVAAGVEPPDTGVVRFQGREQAGDGRALGAGVGFCRRAPRGGEGRTVLEELVIGQLACGVAPRLARARAWEALRRSGAGDCSARGLHELDGAEEVRVALARALAPGPSLLVIDEPTGGVDLLQRDGILSLLRSLADEGTAILMSTGESTGLSGADRALSLSNGELNGSAAPELAPVIPLRRLASA